MLRIAICDKSKKQQSELLNYIAHDTEIGDDYTTECFSDVRTIRARIECHDFNFDLLFLEVDAAGKKGLAIAAYIRQQKIDIDIIFLASNLDFIAEGFHLKAFNYIVKPLTYDHFCYEMKQYLNEKRQYQNEYLSVQVQGKEQMISLNMVSHFTSDARKIGAYFSNTDEVVWFYGKLDDLEKKLMDYGFLRCHQSYLVNICRIDAITSERIQTKNGDFPISRKYSANVKEKWEKYKKVHNAAKLDIEKRKQNEKYAGFEHDNMVSDGSSTVIVTKSYAFGSARYGVIVGVRGVRRNDTFRLYSGEEIVIGRDVKQSQIVINDSTISRKHCGIRFDEKEQCYYVCDYSSNGTFMGSRQKLAKNEWNKVKRDTLIQLTNENCSFMLL